MVDQPANPRLKDLLVEHLDLAVNLRRLKIYFDADKCRGVWECIQVCPVGCWEADLPAKKARFVHAERCIACNACVLQCPEDAIELRV
jgi:NAD-dependent dihydropyrimidine dehydrogenase PreA subunit